MPVQAETPVVDHGRRAAGWSRALTVVALVAVAIAIPHVAYRTGGQRHDLGLRTELALVTTIALGLACGGLLRSKLLVLAIPAVSMLCGLRLNLKQELFLELEEGTGYVVSTLMAGLVPAFLAHWLREEWARRRRQDAA